MQISRHPKRWLYPLRNMNPIVEFLIKWLLSYLFSRLVSGAGHTKAVDHMLGIIENTRPVPDDPLPSPAAQRKPKGYSG